MPRETRLPEWSKTNGPLPPPMQYTGSMHIDSISHHPTSITQKFSARLTPWKAPPTRLAQQYQNHIDHFERGLKDIVFP